MSKDSRRASASVTITVTDEPALFDLSIERSRTKICGGDQQLTFRLISDKSFSSQSEVTWSVVSATSSVPQFVVLMKTAYLWSIRGLPPGSDYAVRAVVFSSDAGYRVVGTAAVDLQMCAVPVGGTCSISPTIGVSGSTLFELQ